MTFAAFFCQSNIGNDIYIYILAKNSFQNTSFIIIDSEYYMHFLLNFLPINAIFHI